MGCPRLDNLSHPRGPFLGPMPLLLSCSGWGARWLWEMQHWVVCKDQGVRGWKTPYFCMTTHVSHCPPGSSNTLGKFCHRAFALALSLVSYASTHGLLSHFLQGFTQTSLYHWGLSSSPYFTLHPFSWFSPTHYQLLNILNILLTYVAHGLSPPL